MRTRSLLAAIILFSIYSLVSAVWLVVMDAPDVAFTEAVVGAGVSTIVLLRRHPANARRSGEARLAQA